MSWGRLEDTVHDEPKFYRLADELGISFVQAAGHVCVMWSWAHRHAPDGDLRDFDAADIARAARWDGDAQSFIDALTAKRIELLDKTQHGYRIHAFAIRAEAHKAAKKKAKQRSDRDSEKAVPGQSPDGPENVPEEREEREERDPSVVSLTGDGAPPEGKPPGYPYPPIDDESGARPTRFLEPHILSEARRLAAKHKRITYPPNDTRDMARAAGKILATYPEAKDWQRALERFFGDGFYVSVGFSLQWLAKNVAQVLGREKPPSSGPGRASGDDSGKRAGAFNALAADNLKRLEENAKSADTPEARTAAAEALATMRRTLRIGDT